MSRRDRGNPYHRLDLQMYSRYTRKQILQLPEMQNYVEVHPNLYGVENRLLAGFVDTQRFEDVNPSYITASTLDWFERPSLTAFQGGSMSAKIDYFPSFHLFAKHHESESYFFIGLISKIEVSFGSTFWRVAEDVHAITTLYLDEPIETQALIDLKGGEWFAEFNRDTFVALNSVELIAEIHNQVARHKLLTISMIRYDDLSLNVQFYDYRCSIALSRNNQYLGAVVDESIPDDKARLMTLNGDSVAIELQRTIEKTIGMNVIEHIIKTGSQPAWIAWRK